MKSYVNQVLIQGPLLWKKQNQRGEIVSCGIDLNDRRNGYNNRQLERKAVAEKSNQTITILRNAPMILIPSGARNQIIAQAQLGELLYIECAIISVRNRQTGVESQRLYAIKIEQEEKNLLNFSHIIRNEVTVEGELEAIWVSPYVSQFGGGNLYICIRTINGRRSVVNIVFVMHIASDARNIARLYRRYLLHEDVIVTGQVTSIETVKAGEISHRLEFSCQNFKLKYPDEADIKAAFEKMQKARSAYESQKERMILLENNQENGEEDLKNDEHKLEVETVEEYQKKEEEDLKEEVHRLEVEAAEDNLESIPREDKILCQLASILNEGHE